MDNLPKTVTGLNIVKFNGIKDYISQNNISNQFSILGICDQTNSHRLDSNHTDVIFELSRFSSINDVIKTAVLFRNSDSLIIYAKSTIKTLFNDLNANELFQNVDINGKQAVLFISDKKTNLCFRKNISESDLQSSEVFNTLFNFELKELNPSYYYRSSVLQFNTKFTDAQKQIKLGHYDQALKALYACKNNSVLFSNELLQVEALRKWQKNDEADALVNEQASKLPYNHFANNFVIKDLENQLSLTKDHCNKLDLLIYDRIFPSPNCSFAICEFNSYLDSFDSSRVFTSGIDFPKDKSFPNLLNDYEKLYPKFVNRIEKINAKSKVYAKVYYTLFLGNAYLLLPLAEASNASLIFTLYSGGEFCLDDSQSNQMLKEIFASPAFAKVIVVQKPIYDYLIKNEMVAIDKIEFIYGPICNTEYLVNNRHPKTRYPNSKSTFDIAFVANKNMPKGEDKGYDTFLETAILLLKTSDRFRFHIVGGFTEEDIPMGTHRNYFTFYGHRPMQFFSAFYARIDLIMSPCRPNVLAKGAIDGAPNVSAIEAGLSGAAVFVTDQLGQNLKYEWDKEIVKLSDDPVYNSRKILSFFNNPEKLYELAEKGAYKFAKVSSFESQLQPRIKLIKEAIEKHS